MKQSDAILEYLQQFGTITPMEAFRDLGITKLATRVSEMKRTGIEFDTDTVTIKNRLGHTVNYARYSLREER